MSEKENDFLVVDDDRVNKIRESLVPENLIVAMSENFRVLSDPTRIRILLALENGELCVCDIAALIKLPQPSVSHHLKATGYYKIQKIRQDDFVLIKGYKNFRSSGRGTGFFQEACLTYDELSNGVLLIY